MGTSEEMKKSIALEELSDNNRTEGEISDNEATEASGGWNDAPVEIVPPSSGPATPRSKK